MDGTEDRLNGIDSSSVQSCTRSFTNQVKFGFPTFGPVLAKGGPRKSMAFNQTVTALDVELCLVFTEPAGENESGTDK